MRRLLAQSCPTGTSAESLFSLTVNDRFFNIDTLVITNVVYSPVKVSVFHDADGSTYDATTALLFEYLLDVGSQLVLNLNIADYLTAGNVGIQIDTANGACFTAYGEIPGEEL